MLFLLLLHLQVHYYVLYIKPSRIHQRKFDAAGLELEPNFSDTKKVNTGFLMSSYSEFRDFSTHPLLCRHEG